MKKFIKVPEKNRDGFFWNLSRTKNVFFCGFFIKIFQKGLFYTISVSDRVRRLSNVLKGHFKNMLKALFGFSLLWERLFLKSQFQSYHGHLNTIFPADGTS